jgi:hypothetical protein
MTRPFSNISRGLVALLLLAGCTDQPLQPGAELGPGAASLAASVAKGKAPLVSNRVRYSVTGLQAAVATDGDVQLTARALLGSDGVTRLEVTTGQLDSDAPAPGNLERVQVKGIVQPEDSVVAVDNYNGLEAGGSAVFDYPGYGRGDQLNVQAMVTGIDRRPHVLSVLETVKLRPDLVASDLTAPATAIVNTFVSLSATVREVNQDLGAQADCVLYVDDVAVDRASGIWVDAGGEVACLFTHRFTSEGTHSLRVAAEGVRPGDYDAANNAVVGSIRVGEPAIWGYLTAKDDSFTDDRYENWTYEDGSSGGTERHSSGRRQLVFVQASIQTLVGQPDQLVVSETSNGQTLTTFDTAVPGWDSSNSFASCVNRYAAAANAWLQVCNYNLYGLAYIDYQSYSEDVLYYSRQTYRTVYGEEYAWDVHSVTRPGSLRTLGPDLRLQLRIGSGAKSYTADAVVPLSPYTNNYTWGPEYSAGGGFQYTRGGEHTESGVQGSVRF